MVKKQRAAGKKGQSFFFALFLFCTKLGKGTGSGIEHTTMGMTSDSTREARFVTWHGHKSWPKVPRGRIIHNSPRPRSPRNCVRNFPGREINGAKIETKRIRDILLNPWNWDEILFLFPRHYQKTGWSVRQRQKNPFLRLPLYLARLGPSARKVKFKTNKTRKNGIVYFKDQ